MYKRQPLATGLAQPLEEGAALVEDPVAHQYRAGQFGVAHDDQGLAEEADLHQRAVRGQPAQERQRLAQERRQVADDGPGAGGRRDGSGAGHGTDSLAGQDCWRALPVGPPPRPS